MKIALAANPSPDDYRQYSVPAEYRTKADAKIAAAHAAIKDGIVEILRFRGRPPPPGYAPFSASQGDAVINKPRTNKRPEPDTAEGSEDQDRRKRRKLKKPNKKQGDVRSLKIEENTVTSSTPHSVNTRLLELQQGNKSGNHDSRAWKKPYVSEPDGLGPASGPAYAGHAMGQSRSGPRNVGNSTRPSQDRNQARSAPAPTGTPPETPALSRAHADSSAQTPDECLGSSGRQAPYAFEPPPPPEPFQFGTTYSAQTQPAHGGAPIYSTTQYAGPDSPLASQVGYMQQLHGSYPGQYLSASYPAPRYAQYYQPPAHLSEYNPQQSHSGYAVGLHSSSNASFEVGFDAVDRAPGRYARLPERSRSIGRAVGPGRNSRSSYSAHTIAERIDDRRNFRAQHHLGRHKNEYSRNRFGPLSRSNQGSHRREYSPAAPFSPKCTDLAIPEKRDKVDQASGQSWLPLNCQR
jgi:hypothetical protein